MAIKYSKSISDLTAKIDPNQKFEFKSVNKLCSEEELADINAVFKIVTKYKSPTWQMDYSDSEIQTDIVVMQSIISLLAERFSNLSVMHDFEDNQAKYAQAKIRLALKEAKKEEEAKGERVKASEKEIDDAAKTLTHDMWNAQDDQKHVISFVKFVYTSVKDLTNLLDRALTRASKLVPDVRAG